jgi:hypothetical protein
MQRSTIASVLLAAGSALALGSGILACGQAARGIRTVTYPHDFRYYDTAEIDASMKRLAVSSRRLSEILRDSAPATEAERAEVVALLREMEAAAGELNGTVKRSNHPLIDANLPRFQRDVSAARVAADKDPPYYFLAGTIAGSCLQCHGER